ncbi:MAG: STAS domain-containing protein [Magnetococcales bacterium]|nr:STAS domain-containing protein [Magnetococcales bacterium]
MNITVNENTQSIVLPEHFDYTLLKQFLDSASKIKDSESVVVDFSHVAYIDSSGISALFRLWEMVERPGCIRLVNVRPEIQELLDLTGYARLIVGNGMAAQVLP